jgi:hypothetical protein
LDDFVAKQKADDVFGKHSTFDVIFGQELDRTETVIFVLPVRFNVVLSAHTFSLDESEFSGNRTEMRTTQLAYKSRLAFAVDGRIEQPMSWTASKVWPVLK